MLLTCPSCGKKNRSPAERLTERCALERDRLPEILEAWRERGLLVEYQGCTRLTEAGFLLSDALFTELL